MLKILKIYHPVNLENLKSCNTLTGFSGEDYSPINEQIYPHSQRNTRRRTGDVGRSSNVRQFRRRTQGERSGTFCS